MNPALAEAEARAARNGLTLEVGDHPLGASWPGKSMVSVRLMNGREQVAGCSHSYGDAAGRERALSFCAVQVYNRPDEVDQRPVTQGGGQQGR